MLFVAEIYQKPVWMKELKLSESAWFKLFETKASCLSTWKNKKIKPTKIHLELVGQLLQWGFSSSQIRYQSLKTCLFSKPCLCICFIVQALRLRVINLNMLWDQITIQISQIEKHSRHKLLVAIFTEGNSSFLKVGRVEKLTKINKIIFSFILRLE